MINPSTLGFPAGCSASEPVFVREADTFDRRLCCATNHGWSFDTETLKRCQYHHAIDIVPTILEAVGIPEPKTVYGVPQLPMPGVSMQYSFDDGNARDHHLTQYNETLGNRSIYHDGWIAAVVHTVL